MLNVVLTTSRDQYQLDLIINKGTAYICMYNSNTDVYRLSRHETREKANDYYEMLRREFLLPEATVPENERR